MSTTTDRTENTTTIETLGPRAKHHLATPSRIPGRWVLACSGRTIEAFPVSTQLAGYGGECKACQKLAGIVR